MLGVHAVIGAGEAVITVAAVSAVLATRPDLIHGPVPEPASPVLPAPPSHEALHDPRPGRRHRPRHRRLAVRLLVARRAREGRRRQGVPRRRARSTPCRRTRRCPTTPSRASTTRASATGLAGFAGTLMVFGLGYGARPRWPAAGRPRRERCRCTARAWRAIPRARSIASTRGRRSSGSRGSRSWRSRRRCARGPRSSPARSRSRRSPPLARVGPATIWPRVRVILPLVVFVAALRAVRARRPGGAGRPAGALRGRPGDVRARHRQGHDRRPRRRAARRHHARSPTSCTGSSACARRGC